MRGIVLTLLFTICTTALAQSGAVKYWVTFTDKSNSTYSLDYPEDFLSLEAIERRKTYNIALDQSDLPVNRDYINEVKKLGVATKTSSRWFNAVIVETDNESVIERIESLPFVESVKEVSKIKRKVSWSSRKKFNMKKELEEDDNNDIFYGTAFNQLQMINGDILHAYGYKGQGMKIAIMDAGFSNVHENSIFRSLFENNQIIGTFDFVEGDENVFAHSSHGAQVFSIMGGNQPGFYVGAAPEAEYWLFRTEDAASETIAEEFNWIAAAEYADSAGADVINTSLGYSTFDNPEDSYTYEDMDGNTSRITIAADWAASKGILVISSAGNQGNKPWQYITAPADGDSVLAVGAVDPDADYASFSSQGPTPDGRVKPNIMAQGKSAAFVNPGGDLVSGNGTSYAAPLVAGLAACLWQADRSKTNMEVIRAIEQSATQYHNPDDLMGYGLPDFNIALFKLTNFPLENFGEETAAFVYPNPSADEFNIYYHARENENIRLEAYNVAGDLIEFRDVNVLADTPYRFTFGRDITYPKGVYIIKINSENQPKVLKAVRIAN